MDAITAKGLTKDYGKLKAVNTISFSVKKGEVFGLLGPNGAGKTTTIKMLATMLKITSGQAKVAGHDVSHDPDGVRKNIGIVFQDPAIDIELTGRENLDFHARIYGMPGSDRKKRIEEVLEMVELSDRADDLVSKYSGGMKRRLEIARGLMHYPKVLFLDEPTLGLDAQTRRSIWEHIRHINKKEGVTIILTTHYMEEADYLSDRIAIIDRGKILRIGTTRKLKNDVGDDMITLDVEKPARLEERMQKLKWVDKAMICNGNLCISSKSGEKRIPEIIRLAESMNLKVRSVELHKPTLEDVFIKYTGRKIRDNEADVAGMNRLEARFHGR